MSDVSDNALFFVTDGEWKLLLITQAYCVGNLPQGGNVYCIDRIAIIPLTIDPSSEMIGIEVSITSYNTVTADSWFYSC